VIDFIGINRQAVPMRDHILFLDVGHEQAKCAE
jgi:hypothetical protein